MQVPVVCGTHGKVAFYNATQATDEHRGWALGTFITDPDQRPITSEFEIKWCNNKTGEERTEWSQGSAGCAFTIVLKGTCEMMFAPEGKNGEVVSEILTEGMAVFWENSVPHKWRVIEDVKWICVRRLH